MSPEQARGQQVDRRADIWSFGVVLYEMLSGRPAFGGDTVSDVLASVLKTDIDLKQLPSDVPASIRQLLRRCLTRDRTQRLQAIGDARITIQESIENPQVTEVAAAPSTVAPAAQKSVVPWAVAGAAVLGLIATLVFLWPQPPPAPESPLRLSFEVSGPAIWTGLGSSVVLSPDGTRVAYIVGDENQREIRIRALDQMDAATVASGTPPPYQPFFSPDGQWIGFVTPGEMRKVPLSGGTPLTLCKVERARGGTWAPDDTIIFAPSPSSPLYRVPAAGGEPVPITTLDEAAGEASHRWPQVLPGGKAVIFTSHTQAVGNFDAANIEVLVLATGERKVVRRGGSYGRYVPSGHVVYVNQGTLFAVPFDLDRLEATGSPAPVVQGVSWDVAQGGAQFSFSDNGRLAFMRGGEAIPEYPAIWVDRNGEATPLWEQTGSYTNPRLSPDGNRLSMTVLRDGNWDIWVFDLERRVSTRLTFDESSDTEQVWSPDGEFIVFSSNQDKAGVENLYRKRADGSGEAERLTELASSGWATSWSADGRFITYWTAENGGGDLWVLPLEGDRKPELFLSTPFSETVGAFSPNGRWLAYASNETGRTEVYVRPFPAAGGKWQVSNEGGNFPAWSRDGRELFYRTDQGLMVASVEIGGETFRAGTPRALFKGNFRGGEAGVGFAGNVFSDYEVSPDGRRFVLFPGAENAEELERPHIILVTRWFDDLRRTFASPTN
jgi:serine/threonine-protein kinase